MGDEIDLFLDINHYMREKNVKEGQYYFLVPFLSIISTIQGLQLNISIGPIAPPIPYKLYRLYINPLFKT